MASGTNTTTLRHLLTQAKPAVPCLPTAGKNTQSNKWPMVPKPHIRLWEQFNLDTLNESYGHVLDRQVPAERLAGMPRVEHVLAGTEVTKPQDILHMVGWNDRLLRPTLAFAKEHLDLSPGVHLLHEVAAPGKPSYMRLNSAKPVLAHHLIALDEFPLPNLVIGLSRPSRMFPGRQLIRDVQGSHKEIIWPLQQLANLCRMAGTRYGYIMTDQDLVACRFHQLGVNGGLDAVGPDEDIIVMKWGVEMMPVPWTRHGETQLTTDLALWWLCMLAMSASPHRPVVAYDQMADIGEWELRCTDDERGWVRRHRYSNVEQPADPPPPPAYQTPSPGNPAAFAAAVGINMDPLLDLNGDGFDWVDFNTDLYPVEGDGSARFDAFV